MKLGNVIDKVAEWFGSLSFLIAYNIFSTVWIYLGVTDKTFIDPYPSNFYTFLVSWLAIDMSSLILLSEHRKKQREALEDERKMKLLEAIVRNTEESVLTNELVKQLSTNVLHLMQNEIERKED